MAGIGVIKVAELFDISRITFAKVITVFERKGKKNSIKHRQ